MTVLWSKTESENYKATQSKCRTWSQFQGIKWETYLYHGIDAEYNLLLGNVVLMLRVILANHMIAIFIFRSHLYWVWRTLFESSWFVSRLELLAQNTGGLSVSKIRTLASMHWSPFSDDLWSFSGPIPSSILSRLFEGAGGRSGERRRRPPFALSFALEVRWECRRPLGRAS